MTALYVKIDDEWPGSSACPDVRRSSVTRSCCAWQSCRHCWASTARPAGCGTCPHYLTPVPVPPAATRLQQAAAGRAAADQAGHPGAGRGTRTSGDTVWIADSTPVPCGMSRPTVQRSHLAGWAGYGYCASHSRFFWGLRLYLVCTPAGMPILWALANPKLGEREVLAAIWARRRPGPDTTGLLLIADKGSRPSRRTALAEQGIASCARPARRRTRPASRCSRRSGSSSSRSTTPSKASSTWNNTAAAPWRGVAVRVAQRILALTAAIWHNYQTGHRHPSLTAYDH